ncbi:D-alanyl-D-alanine carboxypeptidase family protein [Paenibacillus odorifer]|uniref:D-alanyl-D-alanine carboxypeptidase family protein n=1 Tax=Paenibacillus odorifer TaxID=189426 RepID=UPI00096CB950|nr:D-alanyl-D-alanine carboxypeptidase family protein [Paenibacillus odorifer]OMD98129.1 peptidase M15 [Paenibacillus odorifer]
MKRRILIWAGAALIVVVLITVWRPIELGFKPDIDAGSAVLLDMDSGDIWVNINGDVPMPPASVSKLMTEMIVLDHITSGTLRWEDRVPISAYASQMGGMSLSLKRGDFYTVRELFEGITIYSANDAAVALAEYMAGSEDSFVLMMNDRARSLGLSPNTVFTNASGLSSKDLGIIRQPTHIGGQTMMTARDTAKLAAALIHNHPDVLNISGRTQMQLKDKGLYVSNSNLMLPGMGGAYAYDGADGLKTGYDSQTGYCIAGSAQREGHRLIAVVMGAETYGSRFEGAAKLFDYGFFRGLHYGERVKHIIHALGIGS